MAATNAGIPRARPDLPSSHGPLARLMGSDTTVPGLDGRSRRYVNLDYAASTPGVIDTFEMLNEPDGRWAFTGTAADYATLRAPATTPSPPPTPAPRSPAPPP